MKAMLFAAGLGTRLKPFTDKHPKALAEVAGRTLLEHNIRYLQSFGIREVVVNVHHFADQIEAVLAANGGFGSAVAISDERAEVLETGGGLHHAAPLFAGESDLLVMNVDVLTDLDLGALITHHRKQGALATLAVMDRSSSRGFLFDEGMQLTGWRHQGTGQERIARENAHPQCFAFSGVQVLSGDVFGKIPFSGKFSLVDLYLALAKTERILGYNHSGDTFIDVGKPESLAQAAALFDGASRD